MLTLKIEPRWSETDILQHITNSAVTIWFEEGRIPIFEVFSRGGDMRTLSLILRRTEIDFLEQIYLGKQVLIQTHVPSIGNTSITIEQVALQEGWIVARGKAIMIHFDYHLRKKLEIDNALRDKLRQLSNENR